jgi:menaquinone-dependent protoporphyrinogen oxidase
MAMTKILITYATTGGSTREIAEFMKKALDEKGLDAELMPCKQVKDLAGYTGVVLGFPLYMFQMNGDARGFLNKHQKALQTLPVAVFAGGPFGEDASKGLDEIEKNLANLLAKFTWMHPVSVKLVGGKFDPAHLKFPYNLIPAMKSLPPSDLRDWDDMRAWFISLPFLTTD